MKELWYAVVTNNDPDWGYGSNDKDEAMKMAIECADSGKYNSVDLVTVKLGADPIAISVERVETTASRRCESPSREV